MNHLFLWTAASLIVLVTLDLFADWGVNRFFINRPWGKCDYPFHHNEPEQARIISVRWWGGPALITSVLTPFILAGWWLHTTAVFWGAFLASCLYFSAYEYMHWCYASPEKTAARMI